MSSPIILVRIHFSKVASVKESTFAHSSTGVAKGQIVIGLSPAEGLTWCEHGSLHLLFIIANFPMLAPARLVLALGAVVLPIRGFVVHLEDVIKTSGVCFSGLCCRCMSFQGFRASKVVNVWVPHCQLIFHCFNLCHSRSLRLTWLFLNERRRLIK